MSLSTSKYQLSTKKRHRLLEKQVILVLPEISCWDSKEQLKEKWKYNKRIHKSVLKGTYWPQKCQSNHFYNGFYNDTNRQ